MVKDHISNLIIKIKNGGKAGHAVVTYPHSKFVESVLEVLHKEGFIKSFEKKGKKVVKSVDIELAYEDDKTPKISEAIRISKPSKRVYMNSTELKPVRSGYGMMVLSTSKGVLSSSDARKQKVGGEALFKIW